MRSTGMLALALSLVPGGLLADYIGGAKTTIIGTACVTVSQFLYAVAPDWIVLFYIYILNQISHFYQPALTAIVMDSIPRGREFKGSVSFNILGSSISATLTRILPVEVRGRAVSIQRILDNIGASIASFVAGVFYVTVGSGLVFIVTGIVVVISTLYLYMLVRGKWRVLLGGILHR